MVGGEGEGDVNGAAAGVDICKGNMAQQRVSERRHRVGLALGRACTEV